MILLYQRSGDLLSPISIDYEKPKAIEATVDKAEKNSKKDNAKTKTHKCSCKHSSALGSYTSQLVTVSFSTIIL